MNMKELENWLNERIKSVEECYNKELPWIDLGEGHKVINVSGLSKDEEFDIVNKRNCLIIQKHTYEEVLNKMKEVK